MSGLRVMIFSKRLNKLTITVTFIIKYLCLYRQKNFVRKRVRFFIFRQLIMSEYEILS